MQSRPIYDIWRIIQHPRDECEAEIRALCQTAYIGDHSALCRILGRYKMYVDTRDIGIASHLMLEGYWEMWVTAEMMRLVRRGSVVADIGANLGYFTLLLADLTGPEGRVLSFEPNPNLAWRLRNSIEVNGFSPFTDFHEMALGDAEGLVVMDQRDDQPGGGRTVAFAEESVVVAEPSSLLDRLLIRFGLKKEVKADIRVEEKSIRVGRFDQIPHATEVEFIKIDVEGFEPHVWAGMTALLDRNKPLTIFMEFTISRFPDALGFLQEIIGRGFSLEIITFNNGIQPITPEQLFEGSHVVDNMLVFRR